jgi:chromosome segregation ATPase
MEHKDLERKDLERKDTRLYNVPLQPEPTSESDDLVARTDELIRATEDHAADLAAKSSAAVAHLQEEMRLAERVLDAAETRRRVAEAEVRDLTAKLEAIEKSHQERIDDLTAELTTSLEQSEQAYEERVANLTAELEAMRERAVRAEERADKAESALERAQKTLEGILQIRSPAPPLPRPTRVLKDASEKDASETN